MSRENIELVTRAMRALNVRPRPDWESVNELYSADHVFLSIGAIKLGEGEVQGARAFKEWSEQTQATMPWDAELDGVVDIGGDKVLACTTNRFRGGTSGLGVEQRFWVLVTVQGGKITRTEAYTDPAAALEAALRG